MDDTGYPMVHPTTVDLLMFLFFILLMSSWVVAASLMTEKTNAGVAVFVADNTVWSLLLLLRCIAGAPRTEHYQLVRALSAGAVVTVL